MADTQTGAGHGHITVILDRSGSMESIRADTIGGFNAFLAEQQAVPVPTTFTLVQFDTQDRFEVLHAFAPIAAVQPLTHGTFVPRGGTPLNDAIGRGIIDLDGRLAALPPGARPGRIVFVIVTDGHENASREFTGAQVRGMIDAHRAAGWQFVFLSADEHAVRNGAHVNIDEDFSMAVGKNAAGSRRMWAAVSSSALAYRCMSKTDMSLREQKLRAAEEARREDERERQARQARTGPQPEGGPGQPQS